MLCFPTAVAVAGVTVVRVCVPTEEVENPARPVTCAAVDIEHPTVIENLIGIIQLLLPIADFRHWSQLYFF